MYSYKHHSGHRRASGSLEIPPSRMRLGTAGVSLACQRLEKESLRFMPGQESKVESIDQQWQKDAEVWAHKPVNRIHFRVTLAVQWLPYESGEFESARGQLTRSGYHFIVRCISESPMFREIGLIRGIPDRIFISVIHPASGGLTNGG